MKITLFLVALLSLGHFAHGKSIVNYSSELVSGQNELNINQNPDLSQAQIDDLNHWEVNMDRGLVLIPVGDVLAPIPIGPRELSANHPLHGSITIENGELTSAVQVPVASAQPRSSSDDNTPITYNRRPTLFISIPGWHGSLDGRHSQVDKWQSEQLHEAIIDMTRTHSPHFSEIQYMAVQWQSARPSGKQIKEASKAIRSWLKIRKHKWDVVIIGHSRGGIFAHDLSTRLSDNTNIDTMHTILLDPTAAKGWGDVYPHKLASSSKFNRYGSLHYDKDGFIDDDDSNISIHTSTDSDKPISGYNNYQRNNRHIEFDHSTYAKRWAEAEISSNWGFQLFLDDLWNIKDTGSFVSDGDKMNYTILDVGTSKDVYLYLDSDYVNGNLHVTGELVIGPSAATINMQVGDDGVALSNSLGAGIAYVSQTTVINSKRVEVSASSSAVSMGASISEDEGLKVTHDVIGAGGFEVGLDSSGIQINISIFGNDVDVNDEVDNFIEYFKF